MILAIAWGVMAAAPFMARAVRHTDRARVRALSDGSARRSTAGKRPTFGPVGRVVGDVRRRLSERREARAVAAEMPYVVDLLGVSVRSGCTPFTAIRSTMRWAPPRSARGLARAARRCEFGMSLSDSLGALGEEMPALSPVVATLAISGELGTPIAEGLSRLATSARADAKRRAESRARAVPVRLLFPLVLLVLPAFGLLTVAPTLVGGFSRW